jgi:PII-like signaling protein
MTLTTFPKKRLDIIIEAPAMNRLLELLDEEGVTGYTVFPALAGRGHDGSWRRDDSFNNASHMVLIMCIMDEAKAGIMLEKAYKLVSRHIGIVTMSDVAVVRTGHF